MGRPVVVKRSKLLAQLRELGATPKHVVVGVLGAKGAEKHRERDAEGNERPGENTVAEVAQWNHYGTSTIPARPFLTIAMQWHKAELRKTQARLAVGILQSKLTLDQALGLLGQAATNAVKQTIADGVSPDNAPATVHKKGSSTPLINTGQLRGSITYEVREGGETP